MHTFCHAIVSRFLKLIIAARQHSTEICNACRYWSVLVVYKVDIIRLNHFAIEICGFYCGACHCFYHYTDTFLLCLWSYTGVWYFMGVFCFYLTLSESDIIKLFNQSINVLNHRVSELYAIPVCCWTYSASRSSSVYNEHGKPKCHVIYLPSGGEIRENRLRQTI